MDQQHKWLQELKNAEKCPYIEQWKMKNHIAILYMFSTIAVETDKRPRSEDQLRNIFRYFFSHVYHLGSSVYQLTSHGYGTAALILGRSVYEAVVDSAYLWLCKIINNGDDSERNAWVEYSSVVRSSISRRQSDFKKHREKLGCRVTEGLDPESEKIYLENEALFKANYGRTNWAIDTYSSLEKRARAVDNTQRLHSEFPNHLLEEEYFIYKLSSEAVHGQSPNMLSYTTDDNKFIFGESDSNVEQALGMTGNNMLILAAMYISVFGLNRDIIGNALDHAGFHRPD